MTKRELRQQLSYWRKGMSKVEIEENLGIRNAKGKAITRLWESQLGVVTRTNGKLRTVETV